MSRVDVTDIQPWLEPTKLNLGNALSASDAGQLDQIETEVIGQIASSYDTSTWIDSASTPKMVKVIIAKMFCAWYYSKMYSEDIGGYENTYAVRVLANANNLMAGVIDGTIQLVDAPDQSVTAGQPSFYPNDASSAMCPTPDDPSLGGPWFSLGQVF